MTVAHIINFSIPIVSMVCIGFYIDHICKPPKTKNEK